MKSRDCKRKVSLYSISNKKFGNLKNAESDGQIAPWPTSSPPNEIPSAAVPTQTDGLHSQSSLGSVESETKKGPSQAMTTRPKITKIVTEDLDDFNSLSSDELGSGASPAPSSPMVSLPGSQESIPVNSFPLSPKGSTAYEEAQDSFGSTDTIRDLEVVPKSTIMSTSSISSPTEKKGQQVKFYQPTYSSKLALSSRPSDIALEQIEGKSSPTMIRSNLKEPSSIKSPVTPGSDAGSEKKQSLQPKSILKGSNTRIESIGDQRFSLPPQNSTKVEKIVEERHSVPSEFRPNTSSIERSVSSIESANATKSTKMETSNSATKSVSPQEKEMMREKPKANKANKKDIEKESNLARAVLEKELNKLSIEAFKMVEAEKEIIKSELDIDFEGSTPILYYPVKEITENKLLEQSLSTFRKMFEKTLLNSFKSMQHEFELKKIKLEADLQEKYAEELYRLQEELKKQGDRRLKKETDDMMQSFETRLTQLKAITEEKFKIEEGKIRDKMEKKRAKQLQHNTQDQTPQSAKEQTPKNDEITHESWIEKLGLSEKSDEDDLQDIIKQMDQDATPTTKTVLESKMKERKKAPRKDSSLVDEHTNSGKASGKKPMKDEKSSRTCIYFLLGDTVDDDGGDKYLVSDSNSEDSFSNNSQIRKLREKVSREELNVKKAKRFLLKQRQAIGESFEHHEEVS